MNRVILMGRLTRDPDSRYFAQDSNNMLCKFSLAVNRRFAKQGDEKTADFFNIVTFGKTAEFCSKYFQKGMQVLVTGRLQNSTWDDQQGVKHYSTEVVADEVYFADSKKSQYTDNTVDIQQDINQRSDLQGNWQQSSTPGENKNTGGDGYFPMDDDDQLPF